MATHKKNAWRQGAHLVLIDESGCLMAPLVRRTLAPCGDTPVLKTQGRHREKVSITAALSIWDAAAVKICIEEAGGVFSDWNGRIGLDIKNGIAANPALQTRLVRALGDND